MKKYFSLILILFSSTFVFSQNEDIQDIREIYYLIQEKIEHQNNGDIPEDNLQIVLNQNMPAIGPQTIDYNFYFTLDFDDGIGEYVHTLDFVTRSYNIAASLYVYEEFLYNGVGDLVFYYMKYESAACKEIRFYFSNNELIKATVKELNVDGNCEEFEDFTISYQSKNEFPEFYIEEFTDIQEKSQHIKDIYKLLEDFYY